MILMSLTWNDILFSFFIFRVLFILVLSWPVELTLLIILDPIIGCKVSSKSFALCVSPQGYIANARGTTHEHEMYQWRKVFSTPGVWTRIHRAHTSMRGQFWTCFFFIYFSRKKIMIRNLHVNQGKLEWRYVLHWMSVLHSKRDDDFRQLHASKLGLGPRMVEVQCSLRSVRIAGSPGTLSPWERCFHVRS